MDSVFCGNLYYCFLGSLGFHPKLYKWSTSLQLYALMPRINQQWQTRSFISLFCDGGGHIGRSSVWGSLGDCSLIGNIHINCEYKKKTQKSLLLKRELYIDLWSSSFLRLFKTQLYILKPFFVMTQLSYSIIYLCLISFGYLHFWCLSSFSLERSFQSTPTALGLFCCTSQDAQHRCWFTLKVNCSWIL